MIVAVVAVIDTDTSCKINNITVTLLSLLVVVLIVAVVVVVIMIVEGGGGSSDSCSNSWLLEFYVLATSKIIFGRVQCTLMFTL